MHTKFRKEENERFFLKKTVAEKSEPMKLITRKKTQALSNNQVVPGTKKKLS